MYSSILSGSQNAKSFQNYLRDLLSDYYSVDRVDLAAQNLLQLLFYRSLQKRGVVAKDVEIPRFLAHSEPEKKASKAYKVLRSPNSQLISASYNQEKNRISVKLPTHKTALGDEFRITVPDNRFKNSSDLKAYWLKEDIILFSSSDGLVSRAVKEIDGWVLDSSKALKLPPGLLRLRSFDGTQFISSHRDGNVFFWQSIKSKPVSLGNTMDKNSMNPLDFQFLSPRNFAIYSSNQIQFLYVNSRTNELNYYLNTKYSEKQSLYGKDRILKLSPVSDSRLISLHKNGDLRLWQLKNSKLEYLELLDTGLKYQADQRFIIEE